MKYIFIFIVYSIILGYYCRWGGYKLGYVDGDHDRVCKDCKKFDTRTYCKDPNKNGCKWNIEGLIS